MAKASDIEDLREFLDEALQKFSDALRSCVCMIEATGAQEKYRLRREHEALHRQSFAEVERRLKEVEVAVASLPELVIMLLPVLKRLQENPSPPAPQKKLKFFDLFK